MTSLSIKLDEGYVSQVKANEKVKEGQLLAAKNLLGIDKEIDLSKILEVMPKNVGKYLHKKPGDKVSEGSILAVKNGTLGIGSKKAVSDISGTVFSFDGDKGILTIRSAGESEVKNIFSPVDGEVVLCDNEKITLKTSRNVILANDSLGNGNFDGILKTFSGDEVDPFDLKNVEGKAVAGKSFSREAISKSLGLSVGSIIAAKLPEEDIEDLRRKNVKTPILLVDKKDMDKIKKGNGKKIYIDTDRKTIILQNE